MTAGRFLRACPRCRAPLVEGRRGYRLACPSCGPVRRWAVVDRETGEAVAFGGEASARGALLARLAALWAAPSAGLGDQFARLRLPRHRHRGAE